jgi:hypothetical protein
MSAAAAWAENSEDPVLRAIAKMCAAEERLDRADRTQGELMDLCRPEVRKTLREWSADAGRPPEAPEHLVAAELERELQDALHHYRSAWRNLLETRPTTLLGLSAKVFYLTANQEDEISRALHDDVIALLGDRGP